MRISDWSSDVCSSDLSEEWIAAAEAIREEYAGKATTAPPPMKMNVVITEVPFGEGSMDAHIDTSDGEMSLDMGHLDGEDLHVTVDYATGKRSEERGVGKEGVGTGRSRWTPEK